METILRLKSWGRKRVLDVLGSSGGGRWEKRTMMMRMRNELVVLLPFHFPEKVASPCLSTLSFSFLGILRPLRISKRMKGETR